MVEKTLLLGSEHIVALRVVGGIDFNANDEVLGDRFAYACYDVVQNTEVIPGHSRVFISAIVHLQARSVNIIKTWQNLTFGFINCANRSALERLAQGLG